MPDTLSLDPQKVEEIFFDCFFREGEDTTNHVAAEGLMSTIGFNPERLESHRAEIEALLAELPDSFRTDSGESFLNACEDRHGNQWTGLHQRMEQLFQLGVGIGKVEYPYPREAWGALPGGLPYVLIRP